jgi:tetratricopeptide (TPR) repeat protein
MNEHRLYLPATGLALGAGLALGGLVAAAARARLPAAGALAVTAILCAFVAVDGDRARTWNDPLRLWSSAVRTSPDSWRNHHHLGVRAYEMAMEGVQALEAPGGIDGPGRAFLARDVDDLLDFALEEFRAAHAIYPRAFETRLNLGFLHSYRGMLANRDADPDAPPPRPAEFLEAVRWFTLAEESSPNSFRALYNRATAMAKAGQVAAATAEFERLAQDESRTTMYAYPLADLYRRAGRHDDALAQLHLVERIAPEDAGTVALKKGEVLAAAGRFREAEEELRRAARVLGERSPLPPLYMARLLVATGVEGNLEPAGVLWKAALERGHRPGPKDRTVVEALQR